MKRRMVLTGLAGVTASLLTGCVEGFFFYPDSRVYATRASLGIAADEVFFDSDGSRLHGWWMPAPGRARATVVHVHGNAANVSNHAPLVSWLPVRGINVLTFDYRGFGLSTGSPSLDGVVADARAAIAEARERQPGVPIILFGQSLGGATALRAAAEDTGGDIRLLVIEAAFASYRGIVRDATRHSVLALVAPVAALTLPGAAKDPATAIARLRMPVLLLHGEDDGVIPIEHSERLYAAATGQRQFIRIPGGQHLDAMSHPDVRDRMLAAIAAVLSRP